MDMIACKRNAKWHDGLAFVSAAITTCKTTMLSGQPKQTWANKRGSGH